MVSFIQIEGLTKSFGDLTLFEGISFGVSEGQRMALVARNGAGKSTLLNILAGHEDHNEGRITRKRDLRVGYLEQDPRFPDGLTVLEACFYSDNETLRTIAEYEKALNDENLDALSDLTAKMDSLGAWGYEQKAKQILSQLKIRDFNQRVDTLSGGQLKRVALANVLIVENDLLILDEPTNHLDMDMTEWLEGYLTGSGITLLMVTHDRYFLDKVCSDIIEMDNNVIYSYHGNYSYYLEKRAERMTAAAAERESDMNLYRKELDWMRRQPQARATKAKSRIDSFHTLEEKLKSPRSQGSVRLDVKAAYIGTKIFEFRDVSKAFGDKRILDRFSYNFARYDKLGIVGNNGTGKSTFIRMLMGEVVPDSGTIEVGESVRFGYYSQAGLDFDNSMKVIDVVTDIAEHVVLGDGRSMTASQFLNFFLFPPEVQHNFVARLSGGERRRLYLCTVLMRNPNFLVLDEPTNDLDIMTLAVLENYLQGFKGCLIVVSHDRYFMDKVVEHLLIFKGDADVKDFPGDYSDFVEYRRMYEAESRAATQLKPKADERVRKESVRKLTFNEKREFEALDKEILALEEEKASLEVEMSSGALDVDELMSKSQRISELMDIIDEKSMRWLELSELA